MTESAGFSGKSPTKGRNGWFKLRRMRVTVTAKEVYVQAFSNRQEAAAPIELRFTPEDFATFRDLMNKIPRKAKL